MSTSCGSTRYSRREPPRRPPPARPPVHRRLPGRRTPTPVWDPAALAAQGIRIIHLHFGFEMLDVGHLSSWIDEVRAHRIRLVHTVHDLDNPHLTDQRRHRELLELVVGSADLVCTLTADAATSAGAAGCDRHRRSPSARRPDAPHGPTSSTVERIDLRPRRDVSTEPRQRAARARRRPARAHVRRPRPPPAALRRPTSPTGGSPGPDARCSPRPRRLGSRMPPSGVGSIGLRPCCSPTAGGRTRACWRPDATWPPPSSPRPSHPDRPGRQRPRPPRPRRFAGTIPPPTADPPHSAVAPASDGRRRPPTRVQRSPRCSMTAVLWYLHDHGLGHVHRARAVLPQLDASVVVAAGPGVADIARRVLDAPVITLPSDADGEGPTPEDPGTTLPLVVCCDAGQPPSRRSPRSTTARRRSSTSPWRSSPCAACSACAPWPSARAASDATAPTASACRAPTSSGCPSTATSNRSTRTSTPAGFQRSVQSRRSSASAPGRQRPGLVLFVIGAGRDVVRRCSVAVHRRPTRVAGRHRRNPAALVERRRHRGWLRRAALRPPARSDRGRVLGGLVERLRCGRRQDPTRRRPRTKAVRRAGRAGQTTGRARPCRLPPRLAASVPPGRRAAARPAPDPQPLGRLPRPQRRVASRRHDR